MKKLLFIPAVAIAMFFAACSGSSDSSSSSAATDSSASTEQASGAATDNSGASASAADIPGINDVQSSQTIDLTGDDQMKYDKSLFKVKAGQEVTLNFKNIGKLPAEAMSHNVVILKPGTDVQAFGEAAVGAKDSEHIPQNMLSDVIAHTKMLGPGQSDQIKFTIPAAGVYDYICTFPGHFASMHGKIVAE